MPSGKRSRAQRQAPPPPAVRSRARSRQASPRVLLGIGGGVVAVAVAVVLGVVLGEGASHKTPASVPRVGSLANALPGAADVHALFKGVPQRGMTLGSPAAPVTMTEYIDLQCPYCRQFETQALPGIVEKYVRAGKLKIVLRPWAFIGPDSFRGQSAVLAAAQQNKAFDLAEVLYDNQGTENSGWLDQSMVVSAASSVPGLLVRRLVTEQGSAAVKTQAQTVDGLATADKVHSTPTLLVGRTGTLGKVVSLKSPTDEATLEDAINAALRA